MTRIRYKRNADGTLRSEPILCGADALTVVINPNTHTASILASNGEARQTLGDDNLPLMKKRIKQILVMFGANFTDEVRKRNVASN